MGNQVPLAINETRFEMSDGGAIGDYHTYREGDREQFLEEMKGYKGGDPYILFIRQQ